jgi:putative ATPase
MDLFGKDSEKRKDARPARQPLADRIRPRTLEELVGQDHILGQGKVLKETIERDEIGSLIFWGPPGSGKTTLARIIASHTGAAFVEFSAVTSGIKEIREIIAQAGKEKALYGKRTILFIDEIHRFNKAQQDAFLPHVEKGTVVLIGATTENPSFEVISALLSRCRVFTLNPLAPEHIRVIVERAVQDEALGLGQMKPVLTEEAMAVLTNIANGDARVALNTLEMATLATKPDGKGERHLSKEIVLDAMQKRTMLYDKSGEEHYNLISALHKSIRGGDADAALYWLARMLASGEDPLYLARRLIRMAVEDIGNADPQALPLAIAAKDTYHFLGSPEGELALAQVAVYLALAPKSNAVYTAYAEAMRDVQEQPNLPVPLHIRNAPTDLMKDLDYGKGYKYAHNYEDAIVEQEYLPDNLKGRRYYEPTDRGMEVEIGKRLEEWRKRMKRA